MRRVLWVGLTGGVGAGKSAAAGALAARGAALVDADRIAREVVEPGTAGLAAVVEVFGSGVMLPDGSLDRAVLGERVFGDDDARRQLNAIVHPLVGVRTAELAQQAEADGAQVLAHDVPLLVENGLAPLYHLVLVVEAPLADRLHRLTDGRGMTGDDARARMAAQADDAARREVADELISNDADLDALDAAVGRLWEARLAPYAANLGAGRPAPRPPGRLRDPDPDWPRQGRRLVHRLRAVCGPAALEVRHVGSTAVPGQVAQDVLDLQVEVATAKDAEALAEPLAAAGFLRSPDGTDGPAGERLHLSADPGRPADVHVRVHGTTEAFPQRALASDGTEL